MDYWFYLVAKWVHIVGAISWLGGVLFTTVALKPALKRSLKPEDRQLLLQATMGRYRKVLNVLITLQITGGLLLAFYRLGGSGAAILTNLTSTRTGHLLICKVLLVSVMLYLYVKGPDVLFRLKGFAGKKRVPARVSQVFHLLMLTLGGLVIMLAVML